MKDFVLNTIVALWNKRAYSLESDNCNCLLIFNSTSFVIEKVWTLSDP